MGRLHPQDFSQYPRGPHLPYLLSLGPTQAPFICQFFFGQLFASACLLHTFLPVTKGMKMNFGSQPVPLTWSTKMIEERRFE